MPKNPRSGQSSPLAESVELHTPSAPPEIQQQIALQSISPSLYQPRRFQGPDTDDPQIIDLARSIRAKGVIQPILLRPLEAGFEIVVGERRVRASRLDLGLLDAIGPRRSISRPS